MEDLDNNVTLDDVNGIIKTYYPDADFGLIERAYKYSHDHGIKGRKENQAKITSFIP